MTWVRLLYLLSLASWTLGAYAAGRIDFALYDFNEIGGSWDALATVATCALPAVLFGAMAAGLRALLNRTGADRR